MFVSPKNSHLTFKWQTYSLNNSFLPSPSCVMLSFDDNLLVVDSNPACVTKHPVISAQTNCDCAPLVQVHNTQVLFTFTWKVIWQAPVMVCKNELFPVWLYVTVFFKKTILPNMVLSVLSPSCLATVALEAGLMVLPALGTNMARKGTHVIYVHVLVLHYAKLKHMHMYSSSSYRVLLRSSHVMYC